MPCARISARTYYTKMHYAHLGCTFGQCRALVSAAALTSAPVLWNVHVPLPSGRNVMRQYGSFRCARLSLHSVHKSSGPHCSTYDVCVCTSTSILPYTISIAWVRSVSIIRSKFFTIQSGRRYYCREIPLSHGVNWCKNLVSALLHAPVSGLPFPLCIMYVCMKTGAALAQVVWGMHALSILYV